MDIKKSQNKKAIDELISKIYGELNKMRQNIKLIEEADVFDNTIGYTYELSRNVEQIGSLIEELVSLINKIS
jgi:hypothetical protein